MNDKDRIAYSRREAAASCGVSYDVIRAACKSGQLVERFPTSKGVILKADLEDWLAGAPTERPTT